uniref:Uncharacterized protein n=1 Tax=Steinernema glaseri TaxID=37863 RepID=A0A1I8AJ30_9BILA
MFNQLTSDEYIVAGNRSANHSQECFHITRGMKRGYGVIEYLLVPNAYEPQKCHNDHKAYEKGNEQGEEGKRIFD